MSAGVIGFIIDAIAGGTFGAIAIAVIIGGKG